MDSIPPIIPVRRIRKRYILLGVMLGLPLLCAVGATSYLRLSSDTAALRTSTMNSVPGQWNKKLAVNVGGLTTGLIRLGSHCFRLPPEPRAALDAVHAAEVGIYQLQEDPRPADCAAIFSATDKTMARRGWHRVVGVVKDRDVVAVYVPRKGISASNMKCSVVVLHERDLVVVSARGNLEPLMEIATKHMDLKLGSSASSQEATRLASR